MSLPKLSLDALPDSGADLNDRERLALAMGILREQGWFAPIEWGATLCCANHGFTQMCEHFGYSAEEWMEIEFADEPPSLWWNVQADSFAFQGSAAASTVMSPEMSERVDAAYAEFGDDDELMTQWLLDHDDELNADEMIVRSTTLVNLVATLGLNWSGGMDKAAEAVEVLRSVGLLVAMPREPSERIHVHPRHTPMHVARHEGDSVALWFGPHEKSETKMPDLVLSRSSAEDLMALLGAAMIKHDL